jgi:hypothetical protein
MANEDETSFLQSTLDFYSSKANSHASFVIAGIFGMYSLLVLISKDYFVWLIIAYLALLLIDVYAFLDFSYYSALAQITLRRLEKKTKQPILPYDEERKRIHMEMDGLTKSFESIRKWINTDARKPVVFIVLWFFAVIVPLIIVSLRATKVL